MTLRRKKNTLQEEEHSTGRRHSARRMTLFKKNDPPQEEENSTGRRTHRRKKNTPQEEGHSAGRRKLCQNNIDTLHEQY
jgi:hypothetical protein